MRNDMVLRKMAGHIDKILAYCEGVDRDAFTGNSQLVEACVFNLSQLGELCNVADDDFIDAHPEIPWHEMYGLRNRIVHDYEGVNIQLVWEIIRDDLPELKKDIEKLL